MVLGIDDLEKLDSIIKISDADTMLVVETSAEEIQGLLSYLKEHQGFIYLCDVFTLEHNQADELINYVIKNLETNQILCIRCQTSRSKLIPSNSSIWKSCLIKERMAKEIEGAFFEFDISSPLIQTEKNNDVEYTELLESHEDQQHPVLGADILFNFKTHNGLISSVKYKHGLNHMGYEKFFENKDANSVLMQLHKINSFRSMAIETAFCHSMEKKLNLTITDRAIAMRMLFLELERIYDHLNYCCVLARNIQFLQMYQLFVNVKNTVRSIMNYYVGNKGLVTLNCIGGMRFDIPKGWIPFVNSNLEEIQKVFKDFVSSLEKSSFWKEKLNCGFVNSKDALNYGLAGPNLRASGINYDLRKNSPYFFYSDIEFSVPVGQKGTVLDRFLVRSEEIFQSLKIINQVLDNIPTGAIAVGEHNYFRNKLRKDELDKELYLSSVLSIPKIEAEDSFCALEASNGEIGIYLKGSEQGNIARIRISGHDDCALELYLKRIIGQDYDDAMLIYQSFNIHMSEVEK